MPVQSQALERTSSGGLLGLGLQDYSVATHSLFQQLRRGKLPNGQPEELRIPKVSGLAVGINAAKSLSQGFDAMNHLHEQARSPSD
ncbi:hypothetical protein HDU82_006010, partial [Entophlyctis luteolus]